LSLQFLFFQLNHCISLNLLLFLFPQLSRSFSRDRSVDRVARLRAGQSTNRGLITGSGNASTADSGVPLQQVRGLKPKPIFHFHRETLFKTSVAVAHPLWHTL
jgi:hypothetical protein